MSTQNPWEAGGQRQGRQFARHGPAQRPEPLDVSYCKWAYLKKDEKYDARLLLSV